MNTPVVVGYSLGVLLDPLGGAGFSAFRIAFANGGSKRFVDHGVNSDPSL